MSPPYPKHQPRNPFSSREEESASANSNVPRRTANVVCAGIAFVLVFVLFSLESSGRLFENGDQESDGIVVMKGLRSHIKFLPKLLVSLPSADKLEHASLRKVPVAKVISALDEDSNSNEEDDGEERPLVLDPEYEVTKNKRIGEAKEMVKLEHKEIHKTVKNHVFGQEGSDGTDLDERQPLEEITPKVVSKIVFNGNSPSKKIQEREGTTTSEDIELASILEKAPGESQFAAA